MGTKRKIKKTFSKIKENRPCTHREIVRAAKSINKGLRGIISAFNRFMSIDLPSAIKKASEAIEKMAKKESAT